MATGFVNPGDLVTGSAVPDGFTTRWGSGISVEDNASALYSKHIKVDVDNPNLFSVDGLDGAADVEMVIAWRMYNTGANQRSGMWARVPTGTLEADYSGYLGNRFRSTEPDNYVQIAETGSGSYSGTVAEQLEAWSDNSLYWTRFRVNGTSLQLRFWADGVTEPGTWDLSATDSSYADGGWAGLGSLGTSTTAYMTVEALGWATAGDTAPTEGTGSAIATPANFTFTAAAASRQLDGAWDAVAEAGTYDWQVELESSGAWTTFQSGSTASTSFQLTDADGVDWARTYRGRVRAVPA